MWLINSSHRIPRFSQVIAFIFADNYINKKAPSVKNDAFGYFYLILKSKNSYIYSSVFSFTFIGIIRFTNRVLGAVAFCLYPV